MDYSKLKSYLELDISDEKLAKVLTHSSVLSLSEKQRVYNKYLHSYGRACITASIALFLHKNDVNDDNGVIVNLINTTRQLVIKEFYDDSNIEEFIAKSKGELNFEHIEMVYQLIGFIAIDYNMLAVYRLLYKIIDDNLKNATTIDFKSRLIEYATKQKNKFNLLYYLSMGQNIIRILKLNLLLEIKK